MEKKKSYEIFAENRQAKFDYIIDETIDAGIILKGSEISSIVKEKKNFNFTGCYVIESNNEILLLGSIIPTKKNVFYHDEKRVRKLLVTKSELNKIKKHLEVKGHTIVPLKAFIDYSKSPKLKLTIGFAIGRKQHDKREYIKERDQKRIEQY